MAYYVWFTLTNFMHYCRMSQSNIVICYDSKRCIAYYKQVLDFCFFSKINKTNYFKYNYSRLSTDYYFLYSEHSKR